MIKYVFADDEPLRIRDAKHADPQVLGEALAEITESAKGRLKPQDVVLAARPATSPLHRHFEWDDTVAADQYRLDQARSIIRIVRVVEPGNHEPSRAYVSISDRAGTAYRPIGDVKNSVDLQARLLKQLDAELDAIQRRYASFADILAPVQEARDKIKNRTAREAKRPAA